MIKILSYSKIMQVTWEYRLGIAAIKDTD